MKILYEMNNIFKSFYLKLENFYSIYLFSNEICRVNPHDFVQNEARTKSTVLE